jgi:hypothetical protein
MSFAVFHAVWLDGGATRGEHNPSRLRDQINRRRAAKGLPPMRKANG